MGLEKRAARALNHPGAPQDVLRRDAVFQVGLQVEVELVEELLGRRIVTGQRRKGLPHAHGPRGG